MDTPNLGELTNLTAQQKAGTQGLLAGQNLASADYLKRYTDFIKSQEGVSAMAGRIGGELGIPTLQANAMMLRNTLTNLPSTYSRAMTGYDVNANQLARIIGQKSSELAPAVETTERSLAGAQEQLGTRMGYGMAEQQKALLPYQMERDILSERQARETTLYSQDNQNELNALISKLQMGVTLSEGEKNRAQELAISEKNFEMEKQRISASQTTGNADTSIIKVGNQQYLIDNSTGKIISKYGTTGGGGSTTQSYFNTPNAWS
jgi:S-adenosylmethionine synthetase